MRIIRAVTMLLVGGVAAGRSQVRNDELGYTLTPPPGFQEFPEGLSQKDVVGCWTEATPASADGAIVLCIQRMRGTLPREAMRQADVPAPTQVVSYKWKGFDINGLRTLTEQNGRPVFVLVAQVPLRREAVQLFAGGPADQETRAQEIMMATLATFEGETNWLTSAQRSERLGRGVGTLLALVVAAVVVRIWRKRREAAA